MVTRPPALLPPVAEGTAVVLTHALRPAWVDGVVDQVPVDLRSSMPELLEGVERGSRIRVESAWFGGETREIAPTQADAALTPALFEAMADPYAAIAVRTGHTSPEDARRR